MNIPGLNFDHSHHKLALRGLSSPPDVLSFDGREQLSQPFCYDIQFTSPDPALAPEAVLMQDGAFSLCAPRVQGMPVQVPLRTLYGVVTGFKHLSSSRDEARYAVRLEPRLALLARSHQNAIYQNQSVPQIVEKILRERHGMRGQDFVFHLRAELTELPVNEFGEYNVQFLLADHNDVPYINTRYIATSSNGTTKEGVSNNEGLTENFSADTKELVRVRILHQNIDMLLGGVSE